MMSESEFFHDWIEMIVNEDVHRDNIPVVFLLERAIDISIEAETLRGEVLNLNRENDHLREKLGEI